MRIEPGPAWAGVSRGLPLIVLLDGGRDAGATVRQMITALVPEEPADRNRRADGEAARSGGKAAAPPHGASDDLVATFDPDELLDYRARRPVATIRGLDLVALRGARLDVRLLDDSLGQRYLLLAGFEPDFRWRGFADRVVELAERFEVASTTWVGAVPMPVPHTRPIRVAVSGNRPDAAARLTAWRPSTDAPAFAMHLVEGRLAARKLPVLGIVPLVPHYLAEGLVPAAALRALEAIGTATGIMLRTDDLRERDRAFRVEVAEQMRQHEEVRRLVETLERQHDAFAKGMPDANGLADADGALPTADAIGEELERFLAARRDRDV